MTLSAADHPDPGPWTLPPPAVLTPLLVALVAALLLVLTALWALEVWPPAPLPASLARYLDNGLCQLIGLVFLTLALFAALQADAATLERGRWQGRPPRHLRRLRQWLSGVAAAPLPAKIDGVAAERVRDWRAEAVWRRLEPLRFGVWALPILGFIGTVIGISGAVAGLETLLASAGSAGPAPAVGGVTGQLYFAFDTTLVGLVLMLPLALLLSWRRAQELALDRLIEDALRARNAEHGTLVDATAPLDAAAAEEPEA